MYLLETHHYDGGLKVTLFGEQVRPSWAPPSEAIMLSADVGLDADDFAVEFSRFRLGEMSSVTWLGCYMKSEDRQYGDRSNYVAAGLWLNNALLFRSGEVFAALKQGLRELRAQGLTPDLSARFERFAKGLASQIAPLKQFPAGASGIDAADSYVGDRRVFGASATVTDLDDVIESAIVNLSLARVPFSNASRVVIWVRGSQSGRAPAPPVPSVRELLVPFAVDLPNVIESGAQKYQAVVDNYSLAAEQARKLQTALTQKQKEIEAADARFRALKDENVQLQAQTRKLEALPYTGIAAQLEDLRRELASVRRNVESLGAHAPQRAAQSERRAPAVSPTRRVRRVPWRYVLWGAAILAGAAVLGGVASFLFDR